MHLPPRRPVLALAALVAALTASAARADGGGRLVLVDPDPALVHATRVALSPWGLEVHAKSEISPGATLPLSAERAREIAEAEEATAVAWVSTSDEGRALWLYEREGNRVVAQPVSATRPYDDAHAAALALSLKALLRHSRVAPPTERIGARPPRPHTGVMLGVAGGVRAYELSGGSAEARLWLSVAHLWAALGGSVGPVLEANLGFGGVQASDANGRTTLHAHALALGALGRWPVAGRFDLGALTAATLRLTELEGTLADGSRVQVRRANPTLTARLDGGVHMGRMRLSLRIGLDVPLRTQRYLVGGQPLLSVAPVALEAGLAVEVFVP